MRVLAIDAGFHMGFCAMGDGLSVRAGSRLIRAGSLGSAGRRCDEILRELIFEHRPQVLAIAKPFVSNVHRKNPRTGKSELVPVNPDSLMPLMLFTGIVHMVADELRIPCPNNVVESEARGAFLEVVPRKSKDIETALIQGCRDRGWPCCDGHAASASCIAAFVLSELEPARAHETTPLFQGLHVDRVAKRRNRPAAPALG